jgi:hypothetical protein
VKLFVLLSAVALAFGQSTVTTYTADVPNGGFDVSSATSSSDHTQSQITQSINGTQVPLEQHQERVLRSDANSSVTESIVRRSDPTGQFVTTERTVTETRKNPDGSSTAQSTVYRSDINGSELPAERRTTDTRVAGPTTTVNTVIDRPGVNGSFQTVEKRSDITQDLTQGTEKKSTTMESVYRGSPEEGFREAVRKVVNSTVTDGRTVEDTTDYEQGATSGSLQFQERRVSTTAINPGGGQSTIVDVYAPSADGIVQSSDAQPQLKQEQIITRVQNPDGSVVDTFSVREPNVSDPTRLGAVRQITKTVCTGNCGAAPTTPPAAPPPAKP